MYQEFDKEKSLEVFITFIIIIIIIIIIINNEKKKKKNSFRIVGHDLRFGLPVVSCRCRS